jgi:hypothetical protein
MIPYLLKLIQQVTEGNKDSRFTFYGEYRKHLEEDNILSAVVFRDEAIFTSQAM